MNSDGFGDLDDMSVDPLYVFVRHIYAYIGGSRSSRAFSHAIFSTVVQQWRDVKKWRLGNNKLNIMPNDSQQLYAQNKQPKNNSSNDSISERKII